ncbi:MAG: autotransporter-associated beta strand repeat-containing protein, partial [Lentisphaerota bacterium]
LDLGGSQITNNSFLITNGVLSDGRLTAATYALEGGTIDSNVTLGNGLVNVSTYNLVNASNYYGTNGSAATTTLLGSNHFDPNSTINISGGTLALGGNESVNTLNMQGAVTTVNNGVSALTVTNYTNIITGTNGAIVQLTNEIPGQTYYTNTYATTNTVTTNVFSVTNTYNSTLAFVPGVVVNANTLAVTNGTNLFSISGNLPGGGVINTLVNYLTFTNTGNLFLTGTDGTTALPLIPLGSGTLVGRTTYSFLDSLTSLYVTAVGSAWNIIWRGAADNNWSTNGASTDWQTNSAGVGTGPNGPFHANDSVTFGDAATSNGAIVVDPISSVVAGSMSITNNSGTVALGGGTITAASLSISGNGSQVISNSLVLGSSTLTLSGNGTTTLAGSNAFTGGTLLNSGTVQIGSAGILQTNTVTNGSVVTTNIVQVTRALGTGSITFGGNATIQAGGAGVTLTNFTLNNGINLGAGTATLDANAQGITFARSINGSGALKIVDSSVGGGGTVTLTASNSYTGGTLVSSGTLVGNALSLIGKITNNATVAFIQTNATAATYAGNMSGSGTLVVAPTTNTSQLTLTGSNSYTGGTVLYGGNLLGGGTSLQGDINIAGSNATVIFNQSTAFSNNITGAGSLGMTNNATLSLFGSNSFSGSTFLNTGILVLGSANALGSNTTLFFNGGTLQYSAANTTDYGSQISSTYGQALNFDTAGQNVSLASFNASGGNLTKYGLGTLTLRGSNSYNVTTINGGTLALGSTYSLPGGALVMQSNATLDLIASSATLDSLNGSGTITSQYLNPKTNFVTNTVTNGGNVTTNITTNVVIPAANTLTVGNLNQNNSTNYTNTG